MWISCRSSCACGKKRLIDGGLKGVRGLVSKPSLISFFLRRPLLSGFRPRINGDLVDMILYQPSLVICMGRHTYRHLFYFKNSFSRFMALTILFLKKLDVLYFQKKTLKARIFELRNSASHPAHINTFARIHRDQTTGNKDGLIAACVANADCGVRNAKQDFFYDFGESVVYFES